MDETSKELMAKLMYARGRSPSEAGYSNISDDLKTPTIQNTISSDNS